MADLKRVYAERALKLWVRKEDYRRTDLVAKGFKNHLEYLTQDELEEVIGKIEHTDELRMGWHDLDRIYGTRARRETVYAEMRKNGQTP